MPDGRKMACSLIMPYFLLLIFALSPSLIWLLFFLRKDVHPESKGEIIKIFFYGMLIALPAVLIELGIFEELGWLTSIFFPSTNFFIVIFSLNIFLAAAFVEEILKYLVVREKVLKNPEFDEPTDAMLYMIIAALGFAAFENILILLPLGSAFVVKGALILSLLRFLGATFLHALSSGLVGYFLALSFFNLKKEGKLIITGLGLAILLHALYNFSIITIEGNKRFIIPGLILITLAIIVSFGFKNLKRLSSICKIK